MVVRCSGLRAVARLSCPNSMELVVGSLGRLSSLVRFVLLLCVVLPPSAHCVLYVIVVPLRSTWSVPSGCDASWYGLRCHSLRVIHSRFSPLRVDDGLVPHLPKLSGLALFAAMVLPRLSVQRENLGGEFFRLHIVSEKVFAYRCPEREK